MSACSVEPRETQERLSALFGNPKNCLMFDVYGDGVVVPTGQMNGDELMALLFPAVGNDAPQNHLVANA